MQQLFNVFTPSEIKYIEENILTSHTEWMNARHLGTDGSSERKWTLYNQQEEGVEYDFPMMCLRLVQRNNDKEGTPVSPEWTFFEPIFHRVRENMNLPFTHVKRASVNLTFHSPDLHGDIHLDHYSRMHHNMIFQLSKISKGGTFIFDDDYNMLIESDVAQWSATSFGGLWHAQGFCAPNEIRAVLVITWE